MKRWALRDVVIITPWSALADAFKMLLICSLVFGWSSEENTLVYVGPTQARVSARLTWFLGQQLSVGFGLKLATFKTRWPLWEPSSDHPKGRDGGEMSAFNNLHMSFWKRPCFVGWIPSSYPAGDFLCLRSWTTFVSFWRSLEGGWCPHCRATLNACHSCRGGGGESLCFICVPAEVSKQQNTFCIIKRCVSVLSFPKANTPSIPYLSA